MEYLKDAANYAFLNNFNLTVISGGILITKETNRKIVTFETLEQAKKNVLISRMKSMSMVDGVISDALESDEAE